MSQETLRFDNGTEITPNGAFTPDTRFVTGTELSRKMAEEL